MEEQSASTQRVAVVGRSASGRRLARSLARAAGLDVASEPPPYADSTLRAALLHLPASSTVALEEARRLARALFPTPLIALSGGCGDGACSDLRSVGLAACVPVSTDDAETARSLSVTLSALEGGESTRCRHCPLGERGGDGPTCTAVLLDPKEWTGHDARGALCFPFVAVAPAMRELEEMARRVATSDATVLITGESGTGKEVLARYIHRQGSRSRAPFVKVNCAALPDDLLESEIFGYERGAFTGATDRKAGRFETADGGIIFLDEISEMSLGLQAKLLQVLESKSFLHLGGLDEIKVDVQILAATNRDLEREIAAERFREDLYFRLRVIELHLPPLRDRRDDIPRLVDYFLCRLSRHYSRPIPTPSPMLLEAIRNGHWSGNVRELENALRRLVILGDEDRLIEDLSKGDGRGARAVVDTRAPGKAAPLLGANFDLKRTARAAAKEAERDAILAALKTTRWNRSQAARLLGVSYKTLLTKIKKLLPREA